MTNVLDTAERRAKLGAQSFAGLSASCMEATLWTYALASPAVETKTVLYNCQFSTLSAYTIWLQEHGVVIPREVLEFLQLPQA